MGHDPEMGRVARRSPAGHRRERSLTATEGRLLKHVSPEGLDQLETLLDELRALPTLREKKRGVFYRKSRAFLHFHEDPSGLYADVRLHSEFERCPVTTRATQRELMRRVRAVL